MTKLAEEADRLDGCGRAIVGTAPNEQLRAELEHAGCTVLIANE